MEIIGTYHIFENENANSNWTTTNLKIFEIEENISDKNRLFYKLKHYSARNFCLR